MALTRVESSYTLTGRLITRLYVVDERRRWRDGFGVMHELKPLMCIEISTGERQIYGWSVTCGKRRRAGVEHDPASAVTCIRCLAGVC